MKSRAINTFKTRIESFFGVVLDLILPPKCLKCAVRVDTAHNICPDCWKELTFITDSKCFVCGFPFGIETTMGNDIFQENLCGVCQKVGRSFDKAVSALRYDDESRNMIIAFKHQDRTEYATYFTKLLKQAGKELFNNIDIVIPVPLHKKRLITRRFNQSALLSYMLARDLCLEHKPELLIRTKDTPPQQGNSNKRSINVKGAFKINPKDLSFVKGKNILLIDDVYTTGATAENCSKALKKGGAKAVYVLTIFRTAQLQNIK